MIKFFIYSFYTRREILDYFDVADTLTNFRDRCEVLCIIIVWAWNIETENKDLLVCKCSKRKESLKHLTETRKTFTSSTISILSLGQNISVQNPTHNRPTEILNAAKCFFFRRLSWNVTIHMVLLEIPQTSCVSRP